MTPNNISRILTLSFFAALNVGIMLSESHAQSITPPTATTRGYIGVWLKDIEILYYNDESLAQRFLAGNGVVHTVGDSTPMIPLGRVKIDFQRNYGTAETTTIHKMDHCLGNIREVLIASANPEIAGRFGVFLIGKGLIETYPNRTDISKYVFDSCELRRIPPLTFPD